jgi:hypothetical protein
VLRSGFFTILILTCGAIVSGCDSYKPCHDQFGDRTLPGEQVQSGIPTQLVAACMYGSDVVGPILLHSSTPEAECEKKFNLDRIPKVRANIAQDTEKVLETMDACMAGARGYVRFVFKMDDTPPSLNNCEKWRGQNGINPQLPCY